MPIIGNNAITTLNISRPLGSYAHRHPTRHYTAGAKEAVKSMHIYARTTRPDGTAQVAAIYDLIGSVANNRIGPSVGIFIGGAALQWYNSGPINIPLVEGTTYTIATFGFGLWRYDPNLNWASRDAFNNLPATWSESSLGSYDISLYAEVGEDTGDKLKYPCCAQRPI
ncbi:MAG: hypothetical protein KAR39_12380 [Thermoplasmata archaeon]|nr:hypothetical protein [Thermoplasmata archaeon]